MSHPRHSLLFYSALGALVVAAVCCAVAPGVARAQLDASAPYGEVEFPFEAPEIVDDSALKSAATNFLHQIEFRNKRIRALAGEYTEVRKSDLFLDDMVTTGQFRFLLTPFSYRCDAVTKRAGESDVYIRSTTWTYQSQRYVFLPEINQLSIYAPRDADNPLKRRNYVLFGFLAKAEDVLSLFEITALYNEAGRKTGLKLIPYAPPELGGLTFLQVDFDPNSFYPERVMYKEEGGDETTIRFRNIRANIRVDEDFEASFIPPTRDVEVLRHF